MASVICKKINVSKFVYFSLLYRPTPSMLHKTKTRNLLHSTSISVRLISTKITSSKFSTKNSDDNSDNNEELQFEGSNKKKTGIETTKHFNPYTITDDENFSKKFWNQYGKKVKETKENHEPYHERIKYRKTYDDPYRRAFGILKDDFFETIGKWKHAVASLKADGNKSDIKRPQSPYLKDEVFPEHCDILIIGGGIVGTSIAYHLAEKAKDGLRIVVVEKDLSYSRASTVLSVGGIRQQFSIPENIMLSKYGMDFLQLAKKNLHTKEFGSPNINFSLSGYLTLASEEGYEQLVENFDLQRNMQAYVELLTAKQLKSKFPWLKTDGIAAGVLGVQREGWLDPWDLLLSMNRKCKELGVQFVNGTLTGASLRTPTELIVNKGANPCPIRTVESANVTLTTGEVRKIEFCICALAAGCWSKDVGLLFEIGCGDGARAHPIPVEPRKRFVYSYKSPDGPGLNCPLVIDPNGTYFRRDGLGDKYLCGSSPRGPEEEPSIDNLSVDHSFFEDKIWPEIANICPSFENLKVQGSWAGYYDYNTLDQNAIIGLHPSYTNLHIATGFSGHGIQQGPAAGKAITELILDGEYKTINIERLGFIRVILNSPLKEKSIY